MESGVLSHVRAPCGLFGSGLLEDSVDAGWGGLLEGPYSHACKRKQGKCVPSVP